eukprot:TRINITY_DN7692_c0_g1_i6.p1 TRINITY_DN7692_c0_g1~~TRINITY_DN7692_c0_g1_i6.p1  ORF type:complete len:262 (-),score=66.34 TRINITY_DN7692_c0_g1_i6:773-1558(-)
MSRSSNYLQTAPSDETKEVDPHESKGNDGYPSCYAHHMEDRKKILSLMQQVEETLRERDLARASANQYQRELELIRHHHQQSLSRHKQTVTDVVEQLKTEYEEKLEQLRSVMSQKTAEWSSIRSKLEETNATLSSELHQLKGISALRRFEDRISSRQITPDQEASVKGPSADVIAMKMQIANMQATINQLSSQLSATQEQKKAVQKTIPLPKSTRSVATQTLNTTPTPSTPPTSRRSQSHMQISAKAEYSQEIRQLQSEIR